MEQIRIMDAPEDFEKLGVSPLGVEPWEDGRRNADTGKGNWEWWYFDCILDDGTKAVVQFLTKEGIRKIGRDGDSPSLSIRITMPDGTEHNQLRTFKAQDCSFGTDGCDVRFGPNAMKGDLRDYDIHVSSHKGVSLDLHLSSRAAPYRPGTGFFEMGGSGEYYTWLCAVPKGDVSGSITCGGKTMQVSGSGYHDHQWGNAMYLAEWNQWVWARQAFDDYSLLVFDLVGAERFGFGRAAIAFVQDDAGNLVFESRDACEIEVLGSYLDDEYSGKRYPTGIRYVFAGAGGSRLGFEIREKRVLDGRGLKNLPLIARILSKRLKMDFSYTRYLGDGTMSLSSAAGGTLQRNGELIYEVMFPGKEYVGIEG